MTSPSSDPHPEFDRTSLGTLHDDRPAPTNQPFLITTLVPPESYPQAPRNVQFTRTSITGVANEDDEDAVHGDDLKADPEKGEVRHCSLHVRIWHVR